MSLIAFIRDIFSPVPSMDHAPEVIELRARADFSPLVAAIHGELRAFTFKVEGKDPLFREIELSVFDASHGFSNTCMIYSDGKQLETPSLCISMPEEEYKAFIYLAMDASRPSALQISATLKKPSSDADLIPYTVENFSYSFLSGESVPVTSLLQ